MHDFLFMLRDDCCSFAISKMKALNPVVSEVQFFLRQVSRGTSFKGKRLFAGFKKELNLNQI